MLAVLMDVGSVEQAVVETDGIVDAEAERSWHSKFWMAETIELSVAMLTRAD